MPKRKRLDVGRYGEAILFLFAAVCAALPFIVRGCTTTTPKSIAVKAPKENLPLSGVFVLLDPGHGGQDQGAVCAGHAEATLNYRFAATLAQILRKRGAQIFYTVSSKTLQEVSSSPKNETEPTYPKDACHIYDNAPITLRRFNEPTELWQRAYVSQLLLEKLPDTIRRDRRRVYFLSLHHDQYGDRHVRGAHVLYDGRLGGSCEIARAVAVALGNGKPLRLRAEAMGVLNPDYNKIEQSILVELATISNSSDRANALNPKWRRETANKIADAITVCRSGKTPTTGFTVDVGKGISRAASRSLSENDRIGL